MMTRLADIYADDNFVTGDAVFVDEYKSVGYTENDILFDNTDEVDDEIVAVVDKKN